MRRLVLTLGAAGVAAAAYALVVEPRWYRVRRETLSGLLRRATSRPLRILLLSDLHYVTPDLRLAGFVRSLADEDADLVVAAGDLLGTVGVEEDAVDFLAPLTADETPAVAVLGSNDLFAPTPKSPHRYFRRGGLSRPGPRLDTDLLKKELSATGWTVLEDERTLVETPLGPVEVAGLRDPHLPTTRLPALSDIQARAGEAVARIGVVHAPYVASVDHLMVAGYRLVLAGHTHGGQVRLPGVGALTTNSDLPRGRARGTSRWGDGWLHVSAGLGQSPYAPVRLGCRPEASVLDLS